MVTLEARPDRREELIALSDGDGPGDGPGVLMALAALVPLAHRRRGLSCVILQGMVDLAARHGRLGVLAPVRPTRKAEYPLESMETYLARRDPRGRAYDPWIRVHDERGGRRLGILERAITVDGTIAEWEAWTGRTFPSSGPHAVDGALVPVEIDLERGRGVYVEPNVWYLHEVAPAG